MVLLLCRGSKAFREFTLFDWLALFLPCLKWLRTYKIKEYLVVSQLEQQRLYMQCMLNCIRQYSTTSWYHVNDELSGNAGGLAVQAVRYQGQTSLRGGAKLPLAVTLNRACRQDFPQNMASLQVGQCTALVQQQCREEAAPVLLLCLRTYPPVRCRVLWC